MFVPREILTKPEKLSAEEKEVMETHVEYAMLLIVKVISKTVGVLLRILIAAVAALAIVYLLRAAFGVVFFPEAAL